MDKVKLSMVEHYALLIGINGYAEKPLEGCVHDANAAKTFAESLPTPVHLRLLTADKDSGTQGHQDHRLWPTYDNVKAGLEEITPRVSPGDCVYIHYSGHGIRIRPSSAIASMRTGDVALALFAGVNGNALRYLRGLELAYWIKPIVDKGALVTLALDCCFSGGFSRSDETDGIRCLPYDAGIDAAYPLDPAVRIILPDTDSNQYAGRDASMLPNWLLHPEGYSILAACGPHQLARELEFDDGTKRGALSYLLFRSLAELQDPNPRQQDLYHYLCSLFHSHCPRQDPVLYGNQDLQFFGPLAAAHHHNYDATPVWLAKNTLLSDRIALQAGRAHGVCIGDLLLAYPTWQAGGAGMAAAAAADNKELLLRVTEIGGLTAVAEVATSRAGQAVIDLGDGGWKAKWQTKLSLRRYPILVSGSHALLGRWRAEAASQNSLNIRYDDDDGVDDAFQFHVVLDDLGHWEIRDGLREAVAQGTTETASSAAAAASGDGIGDILDALEHLVWFKHVISINNESPSIHFQKSLSITLTTPLGKTLDPGAGLIEVRDGDRVVLGVENLGSGPLYLHVYNMDSSWQVNNILKGTYEAIPARDPDGNHLGATTRVMNMTMPAEATSKGKKRFCDDIVKVFVTARPTSFACLEMPKLGAAVKADAQAGIPAGVAQGSGMAEGSAWTVVNFRFRINAR